MAAQVTLLFTAAFALTGCFGNLGPGAMPPVNLGADPVGVTTLALHDAERGRNITVEVWYPAAEAPRSGEPEVYEVEAAGFTVARLRSIANARREVAPATRGPLPLVLISHGAGSTRFGNVGLAEMLASHGYVVAAPDHKGHTVADKVAGISDADRARSAFDRPLDLSFVLDELERRTKGDDRRFGHLIDMDRVAVAGHSFGGRTALGITGARFDGKRQRDECAVHDDDRRCLAVPVFGPASYRYRDARIKAALLIAPAGFEFYREDGIAQVDAPVLMVAAEGDNTVPYAEKQQPMWGAFTSPHYLLDLKRAGHLTATDVCGVVDSIGFLAKAVGGDRATDGCGASFLSPSTTLELVANAALPFLALHLDHDGSARERLEVALHPTVIDGPIVTASR